MAIALLGGTFDPVHNAHLEMARAGLEHLRAQEVLFIPTGTTHYRNPASASPRHRVEMLKIAIGKRPHYRIDERELAAGASGYTVDTLEALRRERQNEQLYLLMGADQYTKLSTWQRPGDVRRLATPAVFARPGWSLSDPNVKLIPFDPSPISASEIRARVKRGEDISDSVPREVANYIARNRLYS